MTVNALDILFLLYLFVHEINICGVLVQFNYSFLVRFCSYFSESETIVISHQLINIQWICKTSTRHSKEQVSNGLPVLQLRFQLITVHLIMQFICSIYTCTGINTVSFLTQVFLVNYLKKFLFLAILAILDGGQACQ